MITFRDPDNIQWEFFEEGWGHSHAAVRCTLVPMGGAAGAVAAWVQSRLASMWSPHRHA